MIRVERTETDATPGAVDALLSSLDADPGAWLGCDVQAEGLYRRHSMGCTQPALAFYLDGSELKVFARSAIGRALIEKMRPLAAFQSIAGGLSILFPETDVRPHPCISLLRSFLALFAPSSPELALYGAFSFDYYRLAGGTPLPRDGRRRLVLYFPEQVLVARETRVTWVKFGFPDLRPDQSIAGAPEAGVAPVAFERFEDDLPSGGHAERVRQGIERLASGELQSLVLSQTFRRPFAGEASSAFNMLRASNPYPAMFFLNLGGDERLFGASPDLQVRADSGWVESAPVCGTVRRGGDIIEDVDQMRALLDSDKEDASLAACTDADRNSKAKVCVPGTVELVSRRRVHFFSTIIHTVDHTRGRRRLDVDAFDILLAHSTPATVTGTPVGAALRAIEAIESDARGWYAGAIARLGSDGSIEALTVLRAARLAGGVAEVRTGGNLLADSDPDKEEAETGLKAETLFRVLSGQSAGARAGPRPLAQIFHVELIDCGDPMLSLFRDCLASLGCEVSESRKVGKNNARRAITVLSDGGLVSPERWAACKHPLIAIGASGLLLLGSLGARLTTLS